MASSDILNAVKLAVENGIQIDLEGEKSAMLISAAERALGLEFPPSYKSFLLSFGCGDVGGCEFYGVIKPDFIDSGVPDAIWLTLRERVDSSLPVEFVIVGSQGNGAYYVIDCGRVSSDGESPVILWWPGFSGEIKSEDLQVVAEDFGSFFMEMIKTVCG